MSLRPLHLRPWQHPERFYSTRVTATKGIANSDHGVRYQLRWAGLGWSQAGLIYAGAIGEQSGDRWGDVNIAP